MASYRKGKSYQNHDQSMVVGIPQQRRAPMGKKRFYLRFRAQSIALDIYTVMSNGKHDYFFCGEWPDNVLFDIRERVVIAVGNDTMDKRAKNHVLFPSVNLALYDDATMTKRYNHYNIKYSKSSATFLVRRGNNTFSVKLEQLLVSIFNYFKLHYQCDNGSWIVTVPTSWSCPGRAILESLANEMSMGFHPEEDDFPVKIAKSAADKNRGTYQVQKEPKNKSFLTNVKEFFTGNDDESTRSPHLEQISNLERTIPKPKDAPCKLQSEVNQYKTKSVHLQPQVKKHKSKNTHSAPEYRKLPVEYESLKERFDKQSKELEACKSQNVRSAEKIKRLQLDLAEAQRRIFNLTNVATTSQSFPTVQETLVLFRNLYDQKYPRASKQLKRFLKGKHQKEYTTQIVHNVLFHILVQSYNTMVEFKDDMFLQIAEALNMQNTLKVADKVHIADDDVKYNDTASDTHSEWREKSHSIISKRWYTYFKSNYQTILKREKVARRALDSVFNALEKQAMSLDAIREHDDTVRALYDFATQCCDVCWIMILHEPRLVLEPMVWEADGHLFNDQQFEMVYGSDRNGACSNVLYFVWPAIARNETVLDDQKWKVMVRDDFEPFPKNQPDVKNPEYKEECAQSSTVELDGKEEQIVTENKAVKPWVPVDAKVGTFSMDKMMIQEAQQVREQQTW